MDISSYRHLIDAKNSLSIALSLSPELTHIPEFKEAWKNIIQLYTYLLSKEREVKDEVL